MIILRVLLIVAGIWELIRLILVSGMASLLLNPEGDVIGMLLILLLNSGTLLFPVLTIHGIFGSHGRRSALGFVKIGKAFVLAVDGIFLILLGPLGGLVLGMLEYSFGADFVYRLFVGGFIQRIPYEFFFFIFFADLIFYVCLLLYKTGSPDEGQVLRAGPDAVSQTGELPEVKIVRIEEDD